jgi:hypothetical protein
LINEEVRDKFILVDSFAPGNKLGLVEIIINEKLENEDFKFLRKKLDTGQTVISPKSYIIRFKNRATRWRYNYDKAQNLTDFNLEEFDISEDGKKIATKKVINLYHLSKIKVESLPKTANRMLLPAPKVTFISPEFKSDHLANIFSDIYL